MSNTFKSFFEYLDTIISIPDFNISFDFVLDYPDQIDIKKTQRGGETHFTVTIRRSDITDFDSEDSSLLIGVISCLHVLRYYDGDASIHMPKSAGYAYNFSEFDNDTREKVYDKYLACLLDLENFVSS